MDKSDDINDIDEFELIPSSSNYSNLYDTLCKFNSDLLDNNIDTTIINKMCAVLYIGYMRSNILTCNGPLSKFQYIERLIEELNNELDQLNRIKDSLIDPINFTYFQSEGIDPPVHDIMETDILYNHIPTKYEDGVLSIYLTASMIKLNLKLPPALTDSIMDKMQINLYLIPINKKSPTYSHRLYNFCTRDEFDLMKTYVNKFKYNRIQLGYNPVCVKRHDKIYPAPDFIIQPYQDRLVSVAELKKYNIDVMPIYYQDSYKINTLFQFTNKLDC